MKEIVRILCGSHLYGTNVPESDRDYKIVYIPDGERILLQQADKLDPEDMPPVIERLKKDAGLTEDPDVEFMSLRQYLKLLCQGQTNAMDMFFAPRENFVGEIEPEWYSIQIHKDRWISKNSTAFVSHCRQQVSKDWKKLYHAHRVACQAVELMETGKLVFPRPERRLLTAIRLGKVPFEKVNALIEENLALVEKAVERSTLPEQPDWDYADTLVKSFYKSAVVTQSE